MIHFKDSKNKSALSTRWAQMSKQEQIIERKKMEIQAKAEAQKQAAALAAQAKLTNPSTSEDKNSANIFSNDGSFMSQFKALLEKQQQEKKEKEDKEKEIEMEKEREKQLEEEKLNKKPVNIKAQVEAYMSDFKGHEPEHLTYDQDERRKPNDRGPRERHRNRWSDRNRNRPHSPMTPVIEDRKKQTDKSIPPLMQLSVMPPDESNSESSNRPPWMQHDSDSKDESEHSDSGNGNMIPPSPMGHGPMGPGPMGHGPMGPGPMGPGPMGPGPMGSGPMGQRPMGPGPMGPGPMGPGPMGPGPMVPGPMGHGPMGHGPMGPGPMGPGPMGPGPMGPGPMGPGPMGPGPNMGPGPMMPPGGPGGPMPPFMGGGPPNFPMPPNFMGPNGPGGPCGPGGPMPPNMCGPNMRGPGPNGPMPPFFGPPFNPNMMGPNGPPNSMMPPNSMNNNNMPFMGPRPPFGPNGPNFGPPGSGPPPNMPPFGPNTPMPGRPMPEKPLDSDSKKIQNIPPMSHMSKSKDENGNAPPPPKSSQVLSADMFPPSVQRAAADVACNGDHWENVLKAIHSQDQNMWFLHNPKSSEYNAFRDLVAKYRREQGETKPEVKPEDRYEPEFSLEDDDSNDSKPAIKQDIRDDSNPDSSAHYMMHFNAMKREASSQSDEEAESKRDAKKRKRKSRWGDDPPATDIKPPGVMAVLPPMPPGVPGAMHGMGPSLAKIDEDGLKLTNVNRNNKELMQYAMTNYGTTDLSPEDWKKCEDNFKLNLLYQDMLKKRQQVERLAAAGKHKYEYDSDEDTSEGTWEHKLRAKEMCATERWADELTKQAAGKHHIGDFLPPEELKKFMEKYSAVKSGKEPDLSDYKEFKLKEDNVGFKMLQKLGWNEGQGLGAEGTGIVDPINKANQPVANMGLGASASDIVSPEDDEFDAYRKRMMLAYRFRPNPLNNPRRPYY
ncbi:arginine-glutamic acid dipeptide repeats protein-like [Ostrinia furnacalis]|uniref:arginine-glutamic acid dipeptide repeats protein-like n=1 Tax=Ostrinia furnacalis TaxID=93504 RepID=UPI00104038F5|nr:arginine-glutamic acid dipeptide repeats protein-like [Ostrinia furnacalis]